MGSRSKPKGLIDLALSPWALLPVVGCWSGAVLFWATQPKGTRMTIFLAVAGILLGVGMTATLWILGAGGVDPMLARMRQQLRDGLESARRAEPRAGSREAELSGTAAQTERV